ncbi:uncharacterized protein N7511_005864 [Penicillium nucicola]|uniref:uncharacterized protein n=1 Tax=Penicillium nucicola TaxID=1850975 RepID=UPI0025453B72|nr:uncharacterized protein N7511_005864 [Penicillium nucicola]KAJ5762482.1 hypothetical protein N7511_005864 [Penicillium nucicola]
MRFSWVFSILALGANAQKVSECPLLGPAFPAPTALSKSGVFLQATESLTLKLKEAIANGSLPSSSFSIQLFSGHESHSAFTFSHTDDGIATGSIGVREVNEDSIFRIGSISKLWTMFLYMTLDGTKYFPHPVSSYVPELRTNHKTKQNAIDHVQWDDITIGELASHQAGISRDYAFGDLGFQSTTLQALGFPTLSKSDRLTCGSTFNCDRKEFFEGVLKAHPLTTNSHTPIYSNAGYQILGYALEAIAKADFEDILIDRLIKPLNLTQSGLQPQSRFGVIPSNEAHSWFNYTVGDENPAGGVFSSSKDMATVGRAILSSALVKPAITRRWLKPATHTSSLQHSVGAPWEIYSFATDKRQVDLYSKAGDIGVYSSFMGLSPDYNAGFTVLLAGDSNPHQLTANLAEMIADNVLPALEEAARSQALERFAGKYFVAHGGSNSSITITADDGPGLKITEWTSNSVDMFKTLIALQGLTDRSKLNIRLQPNGLETAGRIAFSAVNLVANPASNGGPILSSCLSWILLDSFVYGNIGLTEFEFELDNNGHAAAIIPRALRITIPRA